MRFAMEENAVRVDYIRARLLSWTWIARRRHREETYETPVSRCIGDFCTSFFSSYLIFSPSFPQRTHRIHPSLPVVYGADSSLIWPDAKSKSSSARIYLISPLYAETTGWPNRLSVPSDWITQASPQSNWICSASNSVSAQRNTRDRGYSSLHVLSTIL